MPHQCKKNLIFLALFLDSAIAGQPSRGAAHRLAGARSWLGMGRGDVMAGTTAWAGLAWLEPRAACAAGVADCGAGAQC